MAVVFFRGTESVDENQELRRWTIRWSSAAADQQQQLTDGTA
jgi:hypothetical protein